MLTLQVDTRHATHLLPQWRGVMTEWMFSNDQRSAGQSTDPSGQTYDAGGVLPLQEQDIALAAESGARLIRCSIEHTSLEADAKPGEYLEAGFERISQLLDWYDRYDLDAILDLHNALGREYGGDPRLWQESAYQDRFVAVWRELARRFADHDRVVAMEPMNEPEPPRGLAEVWNGLALRATEAIRQFCPDKPVIVDSTGYANPSTFTDLQPTGDPNTLYSFHWYGPSKFHCQKRPWIKDQGTYHYPDVYGGQWWDRRTIHQQWAPALEFARVHKVPLFCGEFGCVSETPPMEDVIWLADVISLFDELEIGWTYFHFMFHTADPTWEGRFDCNLFMRDPRNNALRRLDRKADFMSEMMRLRGRWLPIESSYEHGATDSDDEQAAGDVHGFAVTEDDGPTMVYLTNRSRTQHHTVGLTLHGVGPIDSVRRMQPGSGGWSQSGVQMDDAERCMVELGPLSLVGLRLGGE
jgi:endoglucanase